VPTWNLPDSSVMPLFGLMFDHFPLIVDNRKPRWVEIAVNLG
jgi:hypothetical protein